MITGKGLQSRTKSLAKDFQIFTQGALAFGNSFMRCFLTLIPKHPLHDMRIEQRVKTLKMEE